MDLDSVVWIKDMVTLDPVIVKVALFSGDLEL